MKTESNEPLIHTLANGLRIIYKPLPTDVAYCGYAVNAGTRDEADNEQGMAHFVEHMLFKGGKGEVYFKKSFDSDKLLPPVPFKLQLCNGC